MIASLTSVLASCALFGLRHGFDYDHIAAITDIADVESRPADTMRLGFLYALGHAATVACLGGIVIGFRLKLPQEMDRWAERLVGLTLIVLAVYVLTTLVRSKGRARPKSRAALLLEGGRWLHSRLHHRSAEQRRARAPRPQLGPSSCFGIGVIHGLGAETPSQVALFVLAADLGGARQGLLGLAFFIAGLLVMNTLMTASAAGILSIGRNRSRWHAVCSSLIAAYSFVLGFTFLLGYSDLLPNLSR